MTDTADCRATIRREDLRLVATITEERLAEPELELKRLVLVRGVLSAAFDLDRTLRAQTHCALVNHSGTPGVHNLTAATERLFGACASTPSGSASWSSNTGRRPRRPRERTRLRRRMDRRVACGPGEREPMSQQTAKEIAHAEQRQRVRRDRS